MNTIPHSIPADNPYTIYALVDPRNDSIKYVGMSVQPEKRIREHFSDREATPQKRAWFNELSTLSITPILILLETNVPVEGARQREQFWIQELRSSGEELLNSHPIGGRLRTQQQVQYLLETYRNFGTLPDDVSPAMLRYYKREYPKFFRRRFRKE